MLAHQYITRRKHTLPVAFTDPLFWLSVQGDYMAMLRALSTKTNRRGYDRLGVESSVDGVEDVQQLKRVFSVPAGVYDVGFTKIVRVPLERSLPGNKAQAKAAKKAAKVHPLLGLFDGMLGKGKKKMTARPEFSRYIQYLKEGGL